MDNKHQNREAAPYNPDPKWPRGYFEVLEEAGVPEKQHSFYEQCKPDSWSVPCPYMPEL